jgi:hypothetical protein
MIASRAIAIVTSRRSVPQAEWTMTGGALVVGSALRQFSKTWIAPASFTSFE